MLSLPIARFPGKRAVGAPLMVSDWRTGPVYRGKLWHRVYSSASQPWPFASLGGLRDLAVHATVLNRLCCSPAPRVAGSLAAHRRLHYPCGWFSCRLPPPLKPKKFNIKKEKKKLTTPYPIRPNT